MIHRFADFDLDTERFELRRAGLCIPMQPRVFDLLRYLVERPDVVVTKADLLEHVWSGAVVSTDSLTQAMMALRTALDEKVDAPRFVHTVRGRGYRFVGAVTTDRSSSADDRATSSAREAKSDARTSFAGRDESLALATSALARMPEGRGTLLLLSGPAGVGKTRLLAEVVARAREHQPIAVQCTSTDDGTPPLWPIAQVLRDLSLRVPLTGSVSDLAGGSLAASIIESPATRFQLVEEIVDVLASAARGAPLVIAIDDLHFADAHTHAVLRRLARRIGGDRIVVAGAYRSSAAHDPSLATLAQEAHVTTVPLAPLARAHVATFLHETLGRPLPEPVLDKVMEKTGGTPRFVVQLVPVLRAEEKLGDGGIATSALIGGDDMRAAIGAHLASLPENVARVLAVAAVFGPRFALAPLASILELPNADVLRQLDAAEAARVVSQSGAGRYRFNYPLVRDVLYRRLPASERARLHGCAARALESVLDDGADHVRIAEVARHYADAAVTGEVAPAIEWSARAAEQALAAGDADAAASYAARALEATAFSPNNMPDHRARLTTLARGARQ